MLTSDLSSLRVPARQKLNVVLIVQVKCGLLALHLLLQSGGLIICLLFLLLLRFLETGGLAVPVPNCTLSV